MSARAYRLELYRDRAREWRWRLRAPNGEVMATGESHRRRSNARRAFDAMSRVVLARSVFVVIAS